MNQLTSLTNKLFTIVFNFVKDRNPDSRKQAWKEHFGTVKVNNGLSMTCLCYLFIV